MKCLVYKIRNSVNDKLYIGVTTNSLDYRWEQHRLASHSSRDAHRPLYAAMREHGEEQFWIEQIEEKEGTNEQTFGREQYWIRLLNTGVPYGYNDHVHRLSTTDIAIIRYNAYNLKCKEYAELFGVKLSMVLVIRSKKEYSRSHKHVTEKDLPSDLAAYAKAMGHAFAL